MTYLLLLHCPRPAAPQVGALGKVLLAPGYYIYVGSARRGLAARLARHARPWKKRRWHIDYLLDGRTLTLKEIWLSSTLNECDLAARIAALAASSLPRPGFGASDCRCPAHFYCFEGELPELHHHLFSWNLQLFCPQNSRLADSEK